jgi:adenine-specific DNA-methyltransferase
VGAQYPYYLLKDSEDGARKEAELTGATGSLTGTREFGGDVRQGFVYQRLAHVTLGSIANNEEIDTVHERFQELLGPLVGRLSAAAKPGKTLEEWEIPLEAPAEWTSDAKQLHEDFWRLRRERQREIDASIARRADVEFLFDRPYEDSKRIRVTGPFTVESLSPHRVLSADEERPHSEAAADPGPGVTYAATILDNLRRAGVQNTKRNERLAFDRLETVPGTWIQVAGEFTDAGGKARRVAVSLGPEHGTVGPKQIQEAAKEALKGVGFDFLLVLGFAFDAHASETAREITPAGHSVEEGFSVRWEEQFGRLPVLLVRMNPDLAMGEDLLKKTGTGNLFMVFGEPDVSVRQVEDGKLVVEIRGLDVYDPTTGIVRSSSTSDIACWFLDTDYDEESFFVRHAYFLGAADENGGPYDKLRRALRADIDESAWSSLYSATSRPFDRPETGKIAVKVINHYGDEVLKVYAV